MANTPMRILIVAGEASADRYGARLVEKLRRRHGAGALHFYGTGGDAMQNAGVQLFCHVRELAHIGVREALPSLRTYYRAYRRLLAEARKRPPKVAILLDFPDFNLRLAKKLKRRGIRVIYYISPQIWAWRSGRIRAIQEYVDEMLVILPFEEAYYRERGVKVEFVGHPLLEDFTPDFNRDQFIRQMALDPARRIVSILPGSRRKEIDYILPSLLQAGLHLLQSVPAQFVISVAPTIGVEHIRAVMHAVLRGDSREHLFSLSTRDSRDLLANSDFAFVKSGTSTLEAALVGNPFLIAYKISPLSWFIGTFLIHSSTKGLVNLIAQERIVPEFYQSDAEPDRLARTAQKYLQEPESSAEMRKRLAGIKEQLSTRCASDTVAAIVSSFLRE